MCMRIPKREPILSRKVCLPFHVGIRVKTKSCSLMKQTVSYLFKKGVILANMRSQKLFSYVKMAVKRGDAPNSH